MLREYEITTFECSARSIRLFMVHLIRFRWNIRNDEQKQKFISNLINMLLDEIIINTFPVCFFPFQVHIDNEKCRREREARLSGSKLDLSFCGTRVATTAPTTVRPTIDSHGNSLPPLIPQSTGSNNNASPTHDEAEKFTSMTPAGKLLFFMHLHTRPAPRPYTRLFRFHYFYFHCTCVRVRP